MILFLTTADTELLATARAVECLPAGFPQVRAVNPVSADVEALLSEGPQVVLVRLLGGRRAWAAGLEDVTAWCRRNTVPLLAFSGEATPDADLTATSTAPAGVLAEAFEYLVQGGVGNTASLLRFIADTLLRSGFGFEPPVELPLDGVWYESGEEEPALDPTKPTVGIVFYRTHWMSGNTDFVAALAAAVRAAGANALPVFTYSLRPRGGEGATPKAAPAGGHQGEGATPKAAPAGGHQVEGAAQKATPALDLLAGRVDVVVVTVLAMGGSTGADAEAWSVPALETLGVPIVQAVCATSSRSVWAASDKGLSPMDTAMQVALPEFDGRIIGPPFSFKETWRETPQTPPETWRETPQTPPETWRDTARSGSAPRYVADAERAARVAGTAVRLARLGRLANADRRVAIVLSNYPTKHSRVGNAVGLDTPASAVRLLDALTHAGYDTGEWAQRRAAAGDLPGDALIHALIAAGGHDREFLTADQVQANPHRVDGAEYARWFAGLPAALRDSVLRHWGEPPGDLYLEGDTLVVAGLQFGNVFCAIQPPRGFGENPVAIYHDPDLPPPHHYLAVYRWLDEQWDADAVVHLGKHGTLEWLPGKSLGLSAGCAPDAVLGDLPLFYPFVVNDPGEGTQAKRRAHAVIVDHLVPPMTRAETYDELARLEQLLDEYYQVSTLDPSKVAAVRAQIWQLLRAAELHRDLGVEAEPDDFDEFLVHVDGYLCEIKDAQIRGGLHVLGETPLGEHRVGMVLAILRLPQAGLPGLRAAVAAVFGLDERELVAEPGARLRVPLLGDRVATASDALDALEERARSLVEALDGKDWEPEAVAAVTADVLATAPPSRPRATVERVLRFAATDLVPRLARTDREITMLLRGLSGGYVPAGPSGSPTRGRADVLPTGKNFYSVDPKALPSELSWAVGQRLADDLLARYLSEAGAYPRSVGMVVWGTSAMRTHGDDISEILALLGVRPVWHPETRRVTGLEVLELDRPRIDVTIRISGFFRDAFPHLVALLDDAVMMVAGLDEPDERNFLAAHARTDRAAGSDWRRSTARVFGSKPGAYGAGLLPLIDARNWADDADLAEVYSVWGGFAYGRALDGVEARADMERAFARMNVAVKNVDNREHDLLDSDDYFQYHGGMVAAVRALTGTTPRAYVGDSHDPGRVRTRDLREETARVFRSRVANPKWIEAMERHGYKGAFELSATVDYLFGYDATAGVVEDWMYQSLSEKYVFDERVREFMATSNPWALRAVTERLLEAADRGLWTEPRAETLDRLRTTYLELEGDLEEQS